MISFQSGKLPVFLGFESSMSYEPHGFDYPEEDDPALTVKRLWAQHNRSLLSYVYDLHRRIEAIRERLAELEREHERVLSAQREAEHDITLPLKIVRTFPARIVGKVKPDFYLYGAESEE